MSTDPTTRRIGWALVFVLTTAILAGIALTLVLP